jgi:RHH-type proline utilization regulon transcriptional repressor/proline dehydrogenase/delta 1-pyrroline-5-carboxylate dehydrogenase
VYHDPKFRETLCDAVESLAVGSAWELPTKLGPLIRPPSGALERGLKELEPGESWAVMPRLHVEGNLHLVSPGVKWGVAPQSFTHCTELFGPVLGVMRARDLHEAIDLVNATGYGLTSGLESLDDREQETWQHAIRAGNLYINRPTTGAIVLRQPFGGMGKSAFGPGVKAGGPDYLAPLMQFEEGPSSNAPAPSPSERRAGERGEAGTRVTTSPPAPLRQGEGSREAVGQLISVRQSLESLHPLSPLSESHRTRLAVAIDSYIHWSETEFSQSHDHFRLIGEDNFRRYLPIANLWIRVHPEDAPFDVLARACAARMAGCRVVVSTPPDFHGPARDAVELLDALTDSWAAAIEFVEESDAELAAAMNSLRVGRVRYAAPDRVPEAIRRASAESMVYVADAPPLAEGRIELLWYLQEQSLSRVYHRYGILGRRSTEMRAVLP